MTGPDGKTVTLWEVVQRKREEYGCTCPLREGMTKRDLLDEVYEWENPATGRGERRYCTAGRGICPVLDYYYVHAPASPQAEEEKRERLKALAERRREEREAEGPSLPRGKDAVIAASIRALRSHGPMKVPDLTRKLLEEGEVAIGGEKKSNTVGWYLNKAVKENGTDLRRVAPGVFDAA